MHLSRIADAYNFYLNRVSSLCKSPFVKCTIWPQGHNVWPQPVGVDSSALKGAAHCVASDTRLLSPERPID